MRRRLAVLKAGLALSFISLVAGCEFSLGVNSRPEAQGATGMAHPQMHETKGPGSNY
jgi:hypothetical protein